MNGRYPDTADWIIDGQQRMRALDKYYKNELTIFKGTESEHSYEDLDDIQKRRYNNNVIGFIRLEDADEETLRDVYDRMNFGGTNHTEDQRAS